MSHGHSSVPKSLGLRCHWDLFLGDCVPARGGAYGGPQWEHGVYSELAGLGWAKPAKGFSRKNIQRKPWHSSYLLNVKSLTSDLGSWRAYTKNTQQLDPQSKVRASTARCAKKKRNLVRTTLLWQARRCGKAKWEELAGFLLLCPGAGSTCVTVPRCWVSPRLCCVLLHTTALPQLGHRLWPSAGPAPAEMPGHHLSWRQGSSGSSWCI